MIVLVIAGALVYAADSVKDFAGGDDGVIGDCADGVDNDGDQDVVVNCLNEPPLLYRNNATAPRVSVALRGARGNTRGIGARIIVRGGPYEQSQEMIAGSRYLAGDEPLRSFAAGQAQSLTIEVAWPSGKRTVVTGARGGARAEDVQRGDHRRPACHLDWYWVSR